MRTGADDWLEHRSLLTTDAVRVSAVHRPPLPDEQRRVTGPPRGPAPDPGLAFVLAHGFTGTWRSTGLRMVARVLSGDGGVIAFDFRGHGRSAGRSTVGDRELADLAAVVHWARVLGYQRVATIGFSMGAAVAVRHAALLGGVDAVVAVSGPSRWYYRGTAPMRRLHAVVQTPAGRVVARVVLRTRVNPVPWDPVPAEPRAVVADIAPTPLLVVHGDQDRYFPLDHARELAANAGPSAQLWVEKGFGHAEASISTDLTARVAGWVRVAIAVRDAVG